MPTPPKRGDISMTQPAASAPGAQRAIGQPRKPSTVFWLSLLTCGIYGLYWAYMTFEELKKYNGEGSGGGIGVLLCWIYIGYFILPSEIRNMYQADGRQSPVEPIVGVWLLLPIIGLYIYINRVQEALNDFWVSKGAQPVA
jgi:Domain of unknown function (DUF4234)